MPVAIDPPIVIPASEEKRFDIWFYTKFSVDNITPTSGDIIFSKVPMNSETGESDPNLAEGFSFPLWEIVEKVDGANQVLSEILGILPKIEKYKKSK